MQSETTAFGTHTNKLCHRFIPSSKFTHFCHSSAHTFSERTYYARMEPFSNVLAHGGGINRRWPQRVSADQTARRVGRPAPRQQARHLVGNFCFVSTLCRRRCCCCHILKLNMERAAAALIVPRQALTVDVKHVRYWEVWWRGEGGVLNLSKC